MPRVDGPFEVPERINDNAYEVNLPGDCGVLATFSTANLSAHQGNNYLADLRMKPSQQGEDDGIPFSQDIEEGPKSLVRSNVSSKVHVMAYILEKSHEGATG